MLKRILGLLGWLGVALVFTAVALRFTRPEWEWHQPLALAGLACTLLYVLSQWREVARSFAGREARFGTLAVASILVVLAILVAINYLGSRHNKRWDLTAARQFTLSEQTTRILQGLERPCRCACSPAPTSSTRSASARRVRVRLGSGQRRVHRRRARSARGEPVRGPVLGHVVVEYDGRRERVTSTPSRT
jgi:ABC-type uncharacterized transport system involved in gliding motility auxiliary subunit